MLKFTRIPLLGSCVAVAAICFLLAAWLWLETPKPEAVITAALGSDRILLAADGQLLQTLRTDYNKRRLGWHSLSDFTESLKTAVIESEDQRFYSHSGIDVVGLARAAWADLRGKPVQGASTITMQVSDLIDITVLTGNHSIRKGSVVHKLKQIVRALVLETKWSKSEILEAYLNLIHLRGEYQGVPAVSQAYLNKDPLALDESEAYVLAAMISSPNQGAPALKHRACALSRRVSHGRGVSCELTDKAVDSVFRSPPSLLAVRGIAPHLARRLFRDEPGTPIIHSTIDASLQRDVTAILEKNIARLADSNVRDSAAIVIDNQTGHVLAYVGAVSTSESPHVDGVQAYRQAGSSLKPFFYGRAIEGRTLTAASILLDEPTAISWNASGNTSGDVYRPTNYDKHFYGPVSVREALGSSLNVPAVKTVMILGLHRAYQVLQSAHFSGLHEPDFYGVSMALGAVEVRLDELANAYRIYANSGQWSPLQFTENSRHAQPHERVYSEAASYVVSSILSDPDARAIGFGWENPLETPFWTAVKTGTSKDYRDNWCVGFSERYTVGVWAGNFNAEAMRKVSGVSGVGPSWYEIMVRLHSQLGSRAPRMPDGVIAKNIRHQWASQERREFFIRGTEPNGNVVEPVLEKRPQFVFPAEGSVLVRDPHMDSSRVALFVRFKGNVPPASQLLLDGQKLGPATSPFKLTKFTAGSHELRILRPGSPEPLTAVHFTVKGAL